MENYRGNREDPVTIRYFMLRRKVVPDFLERTRERERKRKKETERFY